MKPTFVLGMCLSVSLTLAAQANPSSSARIVESYGKLPLAFEANQGQSDPQVKFLSRGAGYSLFLTPTEAVLALHEASREEPALPGAKDSASPAKTSRQSKSAVLRMKLVGSNAKTEVTGQDELPGKSNYFIGNDPKKWHTNVRQFAEVRYENVYPGVALVYYGHQRELEYDFVLQPGVNPQAIRLGIEGAQRLRLVHGDLLLTSAAGDVHLRSPRIYQEQNGVQQKVRGHYILTKKNEVAFRVGSYDRQRALVIDPVLAYSTYLGGSSYDESLGIAVDAAGSAYVTGYTFSDNFPSVNAIQPTLGGREDAYVTKFNADGSAVVYSTYLGGSDGDVGEGIAVDSSGNAYVCGYTYSTDFPTANAFQPNNKGGDDGFVTKINADGNALVYSTYLGGTDADSANAIAVDSTGHAYVTGLTLSSDYPTLKAIQPNYGGGNGDAFVTSFKPDGSGLVYSTYLGASGQDAGNGIAVSGGNAYVTGATDSTDFPTKNAFQGTNGGAFDAFVTKINAAGSGLGYSTYLGGSGNENYNGLFWGHIAVDSTGNAYLTGWTESPDFPTKSALQPTIGGGTDAFVAKVDAAGNSVVYSTYLGGSSYDFSAGIAVDTSGNAYVTGMSFSTDFPVANAFQTTNHGAFDAFVTEINAAGSGFVYSSYLGGKTDDSGRALALDSVGTVFISGDTDSNQRFRTTPLAFQPSYRGSGDGFVAKIAQQTFVNLSSAAIAFGDQVIGTSSKAKKLKVTNNGDSALTINNIYIAGLDPGDFSQSNTCGSGLATGASCIISVRFTPTAKNNRQAALGISDSDPASPQAIVLRGKGTVVSLLSTKLTFGDQPVGTSSAPQNVTLKNTGSTQLNFTGITITGTNAGDFSQTNTCGASIAAGASCTITVTFKPTAQGTRSAAVSISDDGGGSPQKVALTGTGT